MGKTNKTKRGRTRGKRSRPGSRAPRRSKQVTLFIVVSAVVAVVSVTLFFLSRTTHPPFVADSAFTYLTEIVAMGPRTPGSSGHATARDWMKGELDRFADQVSLQDVVAQAGDDTLRGTNLIASFNLQPKKNARIMLSAHWDTRPWADAERDSTLHQNPVLGANDGGSGVAVLLEIARVLNEHPPDVGVDIILFDLEDSGQDSTVAFALGSAFFVESNPDYRPSFGINVDMVCDTALRIPREGNSVQSARRIVDMIWSAAEKEGADAFVDRPGSFILDDHIAFLQRGIPVVDLIHSPFPSYWHTLGDTIDKCSAASLGQVGNTLLRVVYSQ